MSNYNTDSIPLHDSLEHVRIRPGMYVGGRDRRALHVYLSYVVDHAIEMAQKGHGKRIEIVLRDNHVVEVMDDSGGLSLENHPKRQRPLAETIMTTVGQIGDMLPAVNALSEWMSIAIRRDGFEWRQNYKLGLPIGPFSITRRLNIDETMGNTFTFRPDFSIFEQHEFDYDNLAKRCQELAYTVNKLVLILRDERNDQIQEDVFWAKNGILDYLHYLRGNATPLHEPIFVTAEYHLPRVQANPVELELALQFTDKEHSQIEGFANTDRTSHGGTHVDGLMKALRLYFSGKDFSPDFPKGILAIINVWHPYPQFESQIGRRLMNQDLEEPLFDLTTKALEQLTWTS